MAFTTPVLLLVFNRPDTTRRVFQRIKEIQPSQLFIAADGARPTKEGELEKCEAVKKLVLDNIDWPCEVNTLFRDQNLGCGKAVSGAITWFFQHVEEGIILEDDILPDKSFFSFCQELLEKYRYDDRIKVIGGSNIQKNTNAIRDSYYFSSICRIWGWASWRRVWDQYDFSLQTIKEDEIEGILRNYYSSGTIVEQWKKVFTDLKAKKIDTWDYQLVFSIWKNKGINIVSSKNLVCNIGFGVDATHTQHLHDTYNNQRVESLDKVFHPQKIKISTKQDKYLVRHALGRQESLVIDLKERVKYFLKTNLKVDEAKQRRIKRLFTMITVPAK